MPNRRTYTEEQLCAAVASSTNWSQVMVAIGKKPGNGNRPVRAVAERLGLDTSHFAYNRNFKPLSGADVPFKRPIRGGGQSGLSVAAKWFLDRGYIVSIPLEPAAYDLVAESDTGLQRVQVKTTRQQTQGGRYSAGIAHNIHDGTVRRNANGARKRVPYTPDEIDYFFVITPVAQFLIPISAVVGLCMITLDVKYAAFAV